MTSTPHNAAPPGGANAPQDPLQHNFHRIRSTRLEIGMSSKTLANTTGRDIARVIREIRPDHDLWLSDLHQYAEAMNVDVRDLLQTNETVELENMRSSKALRKALRTAIRANNKSYGQIQVHTINMIRDLVSICPKLFAKLSRGALNGTDVGIEETVTTRGPYTRMNGLHRLCKAQQEKELSTRSIARRIYGLATPRNRERIVTERNPKSDLRISHLRLWSKALETPEADLIILPDNAFCMPIIAARSALVRAMKSVRSILELDSPPPEIQAFMQQITENIFTLLPKYKDITAWPSDGGMGKKGLGVVANRSFDDRNLTVERRDEE